MRTPMMEKIVHTAKHNVKAMVDSARARAGVVPGVGGMGCGRVIGVAASFSVLRVRPSRSGDRKRKGRPTQAARSQQDRAALPGCPGLGAETRYGPPLGRWVLISFVRRMINWKVHFMMHRRHTCRAFGQSFPVSASVRVKDSAIVERVRAEEQSAERRGDLGLLIARLLRRTPGGAEARFIPAAAYALLAHDWPLNVRELEHTLTAAVARAAGDPIDLCHLPGPLATPTASVVAPVAAISPAADDDPALRATLVAGLERHRGNVAALARELGKHREQVHRWLRRLGVDPAAFHR